MLVLSCSNIIKTYVIDTILDCLSFTVEDGDKIGVIGLNGSGKTTLFNILSGEIHQDSGEIYIQKDIKIGYLKQHTKIESNKNVFDECLEVFLPLIKMEENLRELEHKISLESEKGTTEKLNILMDEYAHMSEEFLSLNGYGYKSEIKGTLKGLGFNDEDLEKQVNILSGGQKSRLSLAKLLLEKPDILLLDEPTNHLDIDAIEWLEKFLKDYKGAALIISHDRYFLDNVVNRIFHLENLKLNIYNTNYTNFMARRKKELELYKKHFEDQQKEIKRQEEIIQRFKAYGGERYHGLAQSRQKMLDKMKLLPKPQSDQKKARIKFEPKIKSGRDVLQVENLEKSFGDLKLLKDIHFNIYRGEKVGLIGANGIGKTTLFKIILGQISKDNGDITLGHHVVSGYFDQEMDRLNLNKTIIDEIWDENPNFDHYQVRTILSQFMFIGDDIFKEISDLSGGEKGRLSLLKLMLSNANFLLMDEPTNHLDIDSKEVLEESILDYEGTLFVISHDRYFLNRVTDKILELTVDGIKEYLGNYDYYLEKKNEIIYVENEDDGKTKTQIKLEKRKEKELIQEERAKKKKIVNLEEKINEEECKLEELDNLLCNPLIYEEPEKIVELTKKRETIQLTLDELYNEWILLTEE
ncbi:ABC-F family ATP-binding cassette domain-containing protein [Tissierella sp.]|uniref:ABC-F family ATP-binding cassette domain-containing protein n=1 Tax=Tissierella sp. TaxID=41274 RepID=UPI0028A62DD0|nr:ABC-F family ATP-binding cassette domain-containing protein [Tissierella sp.]